MTLFKLDSFYKWQILTNGHRIYQNPCEVTFTYFNIRLDNCKYINSYH
jgi:hypothetical protein